MARTDWIEAGGLAGEAGDPARVDRVDARRWTHPGIPGRTVVRLVQQSVAGGDDAEAALHGFVLDGVTEGVGIGLRRSLGFPGWALVNDPAKARIALDTWKEMRAHRKRIAVKPGAARDALAGIAAGLAKSAPHFLPTFWEEVGRWFADAGNPTFAASAFERAREAELHHGLPVDEDRRTGVFLEFALLGALTVKSLTAYGKELQRTLGKPAAAERFLDLVTRRTQGGLPPWASTLKDLAAMATAAKLDPPALQRRFLADVLGSPAMTRAPAKLWTAALPLLDAPSDDEKAALARTWPEHLDDDAVWIPWLVARGCVARVDDAAAFVRRAIAWANARSLGAQIPELFELLADRLRAAAAPIRLHEEEWEDLDVVQLDRALALGIPVAHTGSEDLGISDWLDAVADGRGSDLAAILADPRFQDALDRAIGGASSDSRLDAASDVSPAVATLRRRWIERRIEAVAAGSVEAAGEAISELASGTTPATWARLPDLEARLAGADLAGALARSLRWGLAVELAWPDVEAAASELATGRGAVRAWVSWPWVVVADGHRAIAVAPDGARIAHDLHVPRGGSLDGIAVVGDALLVRFTDDEYDSKAYWSTAARQAFDLYQDLEDFVAWPLGGGFTFGGARFVAGDQELAFARSLSDGRHVWAEGAGGKLHRLADDGAAGPPDRPAVFADAADDDALDLRPLPRPGPLGGTGGIYASRRTADALHLADGRTLPRTPDGEVPVAAVAIPGGSPLPLVLEYADADDQARYLPTAYSPDGAFKLGGVATEAWGAGLPLRLPLDAWHLAVPRDTAASAVLRAVTRERVEGLLAVPDDALGDAVRAAFPEIADAAIRAGIAGVASAARDVVASWKALREGAEETPADVRPGEPTDQELTGALVGLADLSWSDSPVCAAIRAAGRFLVGGDDRQGLVESEAGWSRWLCALPALAFRAAVADDEGNRDAILAVLEAFRASGLAAGRGRLRVVRWTTDDLRHPFLRTHEEDGETLLDAPGWTRVDDGSRWWVEVSEDWEHAACLQVLEWRAEGDFRTPDGMTATQEELPVPWPEERIDAAIAAVRERGPLPLPADAERLAAAMGVSRATAALVGSGFVPMTGSGRAALRKEWGIKPADAKVAHDEAHAIQPEDRRALLAAAVPEDPARLWEPGVAADALAAAWSARFERIEPLPDELVTRAAKELGHLDLSTAAVVELLRRGGDAPVLAEGLDVELVSSLPGVILWALSVVPGGDPVRVRLPGLLAAARARLEDPATVLHAGTWWDWDEPAFEAWWREIGGEGRPEGDDAPPLIVRSGGLVATRTEDEIALELLPALLAPGDADRVARFAVLASESDPLPYVAILRSPALDAALAERVPEGAFAQDPRATAPELVARVASVRGWSADTATAYLQLLALGAPTKRDLLRWNGWKAKQLDAAVSPLVASGLLVEGKRARAGRDWFLPGPWITLGAPLPIEGWKLPLYGATLPDGGLPTGLPLALGPHADLFAAAWARIEAGDLPRYG